MTKLLETLGGKLAERWLTMLLVPSVLLMTVAAVGATLRHDRWNDLGLLLAKLNQLATVPALRNTGTLVLLLAGLLTASAGLGLAATALGAAVERMWLVQRPRWVANRRRRRWDAAQTEFTEALLAAAKAEGTPAEADTAARARDLNARRNRIGLARPTRPFRLGDRIAATDTRIWETYQLDVTSAWPRLWLTLPEDVRTEIGAVRAKLAAATRLMAWAVGYLAVGAFWWPSVIAGLIAAATSWRRARVAGAAFAELTESTFDLHGRHLAEALGIPCEGILTKDVGAEITTLLRKRT